MLKAGSVANILCAKQGRKKHMKTANQSKGEKEEKEEKEETVVVKRVSEEKAGDVINLLKMLKNI